MLVEEDVPRDREKPWQGIGRHFASSPPRDQKGLGCNILGRSLIDSTKRVRDNPTHVRLVDSCEPTLVSQVHHQDLSAETANVSLEG